MQLMPKFQFEQIKSGKADGPARMYKVVAANGKSGKVGFISPISHHFCDKCNRLRLTSDGRLRACLLHDGDTDLKQLLRGGGTDGEIEQAIRNTILFKPKNHGYDNNSTDVDGRPVCQVQMSRIGG